MLCHLDDPVVAIREAHRVLKPGGRLALSDVTLNAPVPDSLQSVLGHTLCMAGARSADAYQNLIVAAGFKSPRCHDVSRVLLDTVQQIEKRLKLAEVITALQQTSLPLEFSGPVR